MPPPGSCKPRQKVRPRQVRSARSEKSEKILSPFHQKPSVRDSSCRNWYPKIPLLRASYLAGQTVRSAPWEYLSLVSSGMRSATTAIEYALIAGTISIVILTAVDRIGTQLNTTFSTVWTAIKITPDPGSNVGFPASDREGTGGAVGVRNAAGDVRLRLLPARTHLAGTAALMVVLSCDRSARRRPRCKRRDLNERC